MEKKLCKKCHQKEIFIKRHQLCKSCYSKFYQLKIKGKPTLFDSFKVISQHSEFEFVRHYFKHSNWVYQPAMFRLPNGKYSPDFYDGERGVFIEVAGTRQAYYANRYKYKLFHQCYPTILLEVRDCTGEIIEDSGGEKLKSVNQISKFTK